MKRFNYTLALHAATTHRHDYITAYVNDLGNVIDFAPLAGTKLKLAVDPLGGAGVYYWPRIAEKYLPQLQILNRYVDPTFRFMTLDWDGRIRMDCSSPYAMASMIANKDKFDVSWACDTDHDRHGIVTRTAGLLNPNHYLAVSIQYLFTHRPEWSAKVGIGKTLVSSSIIDRVAKGLGRPMLEVPVGFKWFVDGLIDGSLGFVRRRVSGRELPAAQRHGVDDRQGWPDHGAAGGGDDRGDGQGSGRTLWRVDGEVWRLRCISASTRRRRRSRRRSWRSCRPRR